MAFAFPTVGVDLGLGGSFRGTLVNEDYACLCLPLSETKDETAWDISEQGNHGTYVGTGFTRGVPLDLPEGGLGVTFGGTDYVEVPHASRDEGGAHSLSLANGGFDLVCLFKTSTNDATLRCLLTKQETGATGNGWHLAIQSGAIELYLKVGGSAVLNFQRGSGLADGQWHLVHAAYEPDENRARIYIDGVQAGSDAAGTTEPAETTVPVRVGMFTGASSNGFIGTMAYAYAGREGSSTLAAALQATRSWTDVTRDVRDTITLNYGIGDTGPLALVATDGSLGYALDNSRGNSARTVGYYSPGHMHCRTGFGLRSPVRLRLAYGGTTYYKFCGFITSIRPSAGPWAPRTLITAHDWLQLAAKQPVGRVATQRSAVSSDVFARVLDASGRSPMAVEIQGGAEQFPYALDNARGEQQPFLQEATRIAQSALERVYLKGDTVRGGVLTYESRDTRQMTTGFAAVFDNTMNDLQLTYSDESLVNSVRVIDHPREIGTPASVLYSLAEAQFIPSGQTVELHLPYKDPDQRGLRIGAVDVIAPVANTDYHFDSQQAGGGEDMTANLDVVGSGGNEAVVTVTNNGPSGWLTLLQVRGTPTMNYDPIEQVVRDGDSVRRLGERLLAFDQPYQTKLENGVSLGYGVLNALRLGVGAAESMRFLAHASADRLTAALVCEPGSRIGIVEDTTGVSTSDGDVERGYYINHIAMRLEPGSRGGLEVTYRLAPSQQGPIWILDQAGAMELDETAIVGI